MNLNLVRPSINQTVGEYLLNYDLLTKYNLKAIKDIPKIQKLSVELKLKDFLTASEISTKNQKHILSQTKAYILVYLLFNFLPQINFNKNNFSKTKISNLNELHFSLNLDFLTKKEINTFLSFFFIENFAKLNSNKFKLIKIQKLNKKIELLESFLINFTIPSNFFNESENIFTEGLNMKNLNFNLKFLINNPKLKNNQNIIKNLFFFG